MNQLKRQPRGPSPPEFAASISFFFTTGKSPNAKEAHRLPICYTSISKGWHAGSGNASVQQNTTILGTVQINNALTGCINPSAQMIKYQIKSIAVTEPEKTN